MPGRLGHFTRDRGHDTGLPSCLPFWDSECIACTWLCDRGRVSLHASVPCLRATRLSSISTYIVLLEMESRLAQIAGLSQKDKAIAYGSILTDLLARPDQTSLATDIRILVENVIQDSVGLVIGRQVLSGLVRALETETVTEPVLKKRIVQDTLATIQPRAVSYEEQVCAVVDRLLCD